MKVLQVGKTDTVGNRFNGADLQRQLNQMGIQAKHCVYNKYSDDLNTWQLRTNMRGFSRFTTFLEKHLSVESLLHPNSFSLSFDKRFHEADIVHYHLIYPGWFNMFSLPLLTYSKPSIWTIHDPWTMTGHCVYPFDCQRWMIGCGECPDLNIHLPMMRDNTAFMFWIKKQIYKASNIDIILASKFMHDMATKSPLLSQFRLHHIPFGIDLDFFHPVDTNEAKIKMGIHPNSLTLTFRSTVSKYKGLDFIKDSLRKLSVDRPVCLIAFDDSEQLKEFQGANVQIKALGWVTDQDQILAAYSATDIFLMPSVQEAFGMMAIEAMACGKPVIVFEGTSLPEVVFAPDGGISVPQGSSEGLRKTIEQLANDPAQMVRIGNQARKIAEQNYDRNDYIKNIIDLYGDVIDRRKK